MRRLFWMALLGIVCAPAIARAQSEEVVYYHTDAIGSVRMITDASGVSLGRYDYTPFGQQWEVPENPDVRQFAGKEHDDNGLDYFGARYYSSQLGRFTSVDPVLDVKRALVDPQRWNRYSYVGNRPTKFIDPDGRQWQALMKYLGTHEQELMKFVTTAMTVKELSDIGGVFRDLLRGGSVSDKIDANLRSPDLGVQMEGVVGALLQNKFGSSLVDVNRRILDATGQQMSEADIVLKFAVVEVKSGQRPVDLDQLSKLQTLGSPVIVYAPQATPNQIRSLLGAGAAGVAKDTNSLIKMLQEMF